MEESEKSGSSFFIKREIMRNKREKENNTMTENINTFDQLEKIVLEIRGLPNWSDYQREIDGLRDSYLAGGFDETDRELRWKQCNVAHVSNRDFYRCDAKGFEQARSITRKQIARQMARNEEIRRKFKGDDEESKNS